jgi:hypothetical protein
VAVEVLDHQEAGDALQHRHLDELALAGARAVQQRGGDRLAEEQAGDLVGDQGGRMRGVALPSTRGSRSAAPEADWIRSS